MTRGRQAGPLAVVTAVLLGAAAYLCWDSRDQAMSQPASFDATIAEQPQAPPAIQPNMAVVRDEPAELELPEEEMPLVEECTTATTEPYPEITFEVDALVNDKISRALAEEMVVVAKKIYRMHQLTKDDPRSPKSSLAKDRYFLAIWPDLAKLVQEGRVKLRVHQHVRTRTNISDGAASYAFHRDDKELSVGFHLPNYAVSLQMNSKTAHPELFQEIVAEVEHETRQVGVRHQ